MLFTNLNPSTGGGGDSVVSADTKAALDLLGGIAGQIGKVNNTGLFYQYDDIRGWIPAPVLLSVPLQGGDGVIALDEDLLVAVNGGTVDV